MLNADAPPSKLYLCPRCGQSCRNDTFGEDNYLLFRSNVLLVCTACYNYVMRMSKANQKDR